MNKKIKNATSIEFSNIKFRSIAERNAYKKFIENNIEVLYESETFILLEGFKLSDNVKLISPKKVKNSKGNYSYSKELIDLSSLKIRNITYTPDFIMTKNNYKIYIDIKGWNNDTYPLKKKLFLHYLDRLNDGLTHIFFEPHSMKQVNDIINYYKSL